MNEGKNSDSDSDLLLTVGAIRPRLLVVRNGLLLQEQKEEEMIGHQSRGFRVGEWTEIGLHRRLLDMDDIGMIATIDVRTAENEGEINIEILAILLRAGHPRLHRLLVRGYKETDLRCCTSRQDVMHRCMRREEEVRGGGRGGGYMDGERD